MMFEVPPFYFSTPTAVEEEVRLCPSPTSSLSSTTAATTVVMEESSSPSSSSSSLLLTMLPSELLHLSLLSYGTYGTIAKLAGVRSAWKDLLLDSVQRQTRHQYQLALALIHGTDGLIPNPSRGIRLLQQITGIPIDPVTDMPIFTITPSTGSRWNDDSNSDTFEYHHHNTTTTNNNNNSTTNSTDPDKNTTTCRLLLASTCRREFVDTSTASNMWNKSHGTIPKEPQNDTDDECDYRRKAMRTLAYLYLDHDNDEQDDDADDTNALPIPKDDAANGMSSFPLPSQPQIGIQWLKCAHHIGRDVEAAYDIATIYEYGTYDTNHTTPTTTTTDDDDDTNTNGSSTGIPMDLVAAIDYLHRGAAQGHVECMVELALHYEMGCHDILPVSTDRAYHWYHAAAQRGHVIAQYSIGDAYERGIIASNTTTSSMTNMTLNHHQNSNDNDNNSSSTTTTTTTNTNVNMTLACLYYYQAAMEGDDEDSIRALRRLYDIARIVIPGIHSKLLQWDDKKERILTNE